MALHERLATAVGGLVSGEDWVRAVTFAARFRSRSFSNTLLIYAQHVERFETGSVSEPWPSYVAGFRQWESLGRSVAKGQKGYVIQAPVTARFASNTPDEALSWRKLGFREVAGPGEVVRSRVVNVKPAYVWDVCQTTGDPVPLRPGPALLEGQAPAGLWDGLARLVESEGFTVGRVASAGEIGGANGVTDYTDRTVRVRVDMDDAAQVKTLAHELAHVRMHDPADAESWGHRGIGEVEAESVAMMIGAAHGMPTDSYTVPYVSGWATTVKGRTPVEVVQATGERVRATALSVLNALDTIQVGGGDPPGLDRTALANTRQPKTPARTVQVPPLAGQVSAV
ncbi:MAG: ImmA/IrrE family metallo-endopeptidase [Propionibacteriaceae bacterium]|nr:ImmA/IrrE family metallo-endopeptidase [Propionibacteriaceae bacterium]